MELKRNLMAYYYGFDPTGVDAIDAILEAVAMAGRGYHHTENWQEEWTDGTTPESRIQKAAQQAAEAWNRRKEG